MPKPDPAYVKVEEATDADYLWRIYDFMHLWDEHRELSGGDLVEFMSGLMANWKGNTLPTPEGHRRRDADEYPCEMPDCTNSMLDGLHTGPGGSFVCWVCADGLPEEGDYIISDLPPLGSRTQISLYNEGTVIAAGVMSTEKVERTILEHQKKTNWFPRVWMMSDHGNFHEYTFAHH